MRSIAISNAFLVNDNPVACSRRANGKGLTLLLPLAFVETALKDFEFESLVVEDMVLKDIALEESDNRFLLS